MFDLTDCDWPLLGELESFYLKRSQIDASCSFDLVSCLNNSQICELAFDLKILTILIRVCDPLAQNLETF